MGIPAYVHLLRAKDRIDASYADPLPVAELAATAFASPAHFIRSFKRAFGETPHQYLLSRRVERAKDLLRSTELTVTEISLAVGFAGPAPFYAAFRELVGDTPTAYRDHARGGPAVPGCFTLMWSRAVFQRPDGAPAARVGGDHDPEVQAR